MKSRMPLLYPPKGGKHFLQLGFRASQFTNLRMRMFITIPNAKNMNKTDDPP